MFSIEKIKRASNLGRRRVINGIIGAKARDFSQEGNLDKRFAKEVVN